MSNIKPFAIMAEPGVAAEYVAAVARGVYIVAQAAGIVDTLGVGSIWRLNTWRENSYQNADGSLIPHASIDAWFESAAKANTFGTGYLNADTLLDCLPHDPWHRGHYPHYTMLATNQLLYSSRPDPADPEKKKSKNESVSGLGQRGIGGVLTVSGYSTLGPQALVTCIEFIAMHEAGHVLGLFSDSDTWEKDVVKNPVCGKHCARACVMRLGPLKKLEIEAELRQKPFCDFCLPRLRTFVLGKP